MFAPFLKNGINSTIEDYVEAINYIVDLVGEDCVGIGTDFTQGTIKRSLNGSPTTKAMPAA